MIDWRDPSSVRIPSKYREAVNELRERPNTWGCVEIVANRNDANVWRSCLLRMDDRIEVTTHKDRSGKIHVFAKLIT